MDKETADKWYTPVDIKIIEMRKFIDGLTQLFTEQHTGKTLTLDSIAGYSEEVNKTTSEDDIDGNK